MRHEQQSSSVFDIQAALSQIAPGLLGVAGITLLLLLLILCHLMTPTELMRYGCPAAGFLGVVYCFWPRPLTSTLASTGRASMVQLWIPLLLALGVTCAMVGFANAPGAVTDLRHLGSSPQDAFLHVLLQYLVFLLQYPLFVTAILLLPSASMTTAMRMRIVLDVAMLVTAVGTFIWYSQIGPLFTAYATPPLDHLMGLIHLNGDLAIIGCVVLLLRRSDNSQLRPTLSLLALAFLLIVLCNFVAMLFLGKAGPFLAQFLPIVSTASYMLICVVGRLMRSLAEEVEYQELPVRQLAEVPLWRSLLPYLLVPAVAVLVYNASQNKRDAFLLPGVYAGALLMTGLILARQMLALVENQQLYRTVARNNELLERLATSDPLTDLPNHRTMVSHITNEFERARRYHRRCALLVIDLDHFKALNDTCGHVAGDEALVGVARLLRSLLRDVDTVGRWGGEEFVALLPEIDAENGRLAAERLRRAVSTTPLGESMPLHLTCSIGIAIYPEHGKVADELIAAADRAMYAAKASGRDRVFLAGDPVVLSFEHHHKAVASREEVERMGTVQALRALIEAHDSYTGQHVEEVSSLAGRLARELHLDENEVRQIELAAILCDIGTVSVSGTVLERSVSLGEDERQSLQQHVIIGVQILDRIPSLRALIPLIRSHHEWWNGSGYPDSLEGEAIPLGSRLIAVADAYTAMRSERPYRRQLSEREALAEAWGCAGLQFDPAIVAILEQLIIGELRPARYLTDGSMSS